jgi:hypothetical protein
MKGKKTKIEFRCECCNDTLDVGECNEDIRTDGKVLFCSSECACDWFTSPLDEVYDEDDRKELEQQFGKKVQQ